MKLNTKLLNESKLSLSKNMTYHLKNNIGLDENVFRIGSEEYVNIITEAAKLHRKGFLSLTEGELFLTENVGGYGEYEGQRVPLNIPFKINEQRDKETIFGVFVDGGTKVKRVVFTESMDENRISDYALKNDISILDDFINAL